MSAPTTWRVGDRFVCNRGRTWVVESLKRVGSCTLMLGARCVVPSVECPDAIEDVGCFDSSKVERLEVGSDPKSKS